MQLILTPELMLEAYRQGLFPMAYNSGSPFIHWICPDFRGQLSIPELHIPRRLKKTLKEKPFRVTVDKAFDAVISGCAESCETRPETWINAAIMKVFCELHERGHAHSVECWQGRELVGGIYGLEIGGAFFGESMFARETDASKIALVHLMARLWKGGFKLFDTQFVNDHLLQFGAYELSHPKYKKALGAAIKIKTDFKLDGLNEENILAEYLKFKDRHPERM
jgi:leucyl/phenylalanyl-tRNA--protein transferase